MSFSQEGLLSNDTELFHSSTFLKFEGPLNRISHSHQYDVGTTHSI